LTGKTILIVAEHSKYAIALYEMVCLRANLDRCVETIEMNRFRELLGVPPGAYERADNFMRNVVTPALYEVNGLSDVKVEMRWCVATLGRPRTLLPWPGGASPTKNIAWRWRSVTAVRSVEWHASRAWSRTSG
jgi:hypothetical protein